MPTTVFEKYHASGNDFLVIHPPTKKIVRTHWRKLARRICDRNCGIGADGIILITKGKLADYKVDLFNADGSWAEKSGNGLRIAGLYCHLADKRKFNFTFETGAGIDESRIHARYSSGWKVSCEMGQPEFASSKIPIRTPLKFFINRPFKVDGVELLATCVSTGNPHAVLFVDHFDFAWKDLGQRIEHHRMFPNRTNVEFVKVIDRKNIIVAEWERGAGATGSSGTGAAAAVTAGVMNGILDRKCTVEFPDGRLKVNWRNNDNVIELSGYVNYIGSGTYDYK